MRLSPQVSGGFTTGLVSGVVLVALAGLGIRVAEWLAAHPQPQAVADWLTVARFSVADVLAGVSILAVPVLMVWMAAYGPRLR